MATLPKRARILLELGPFAGGISFELAKASRDYSIIIADKRNEVLDYLTAEASKRNLLGQIRFEQTDLSTLKFRDRQFDGVISRGVFFFLDELMLTEIHRVLKPGGIGVVGGGFGASTPSHLIDEIASESRRLNKELGKKWISRIQFEKMVAAAGLERCSRIIEGGGLWLVLQK
jgi:ubiquinone/menaquinone biosynthesis C-methylase UbiE